LGLGFRFFFSLYVRVLGPETFLARFIVDHNQTAVVTHICGQRCVAGQNLRIFPLRVSSPALFQRWDGFLVPFAPKLVFPICLSLFCCPFCSGD